MKIAATIFVFALCLLDHYANAGSECAREDNTRNMKQRLDEKHVGNVDECANWCATHPQCKYWTFAKSGTWTLWNHNCFIMTTNEDRVADKGWISGSKSCEKVKCNTKKGKQCVFPFKYGNVLYTACTTKGNGATSWCSTAVDQDGNYNGAWDTCNECSAVVQKCNTKKGKQCVFPFKYKNVLYTACTTKGNGAASWCSTDVDQDGNYNGAWDNCNACWLDVDDVCTARPKIDSDCCKSTAPCKLGQGDCDKDSECEGDLICGTNNCRKFHPGATAIADCCTKKVPAPSGPPCGCSTVTAAKDGCQCGTSKCKTGQRCVQGQCKASTCQQLSHIPMAKGQDKQCRNECTKTYCNGGCQSYHLRYGYSDKNQNGCFLSSCVYKG